MSAFMRYPGFRMKALTFSYDDGAYKDVRLAEIFLKYNLSATFNLCTLPEESGTGKVSIAEAKEIFSKKNFEVAVHGARHLTWTEVEPAVATRDIMSNRENLENIFEKVINGCVYPCGAYNDKVVEILKDCGIKYCRTVESTEGFKLPSDWLRLRPTCHHANPRLMELADKFLSIEKASYFWSNKPLLFYVWGHSFEFRDESDWGVIEKFAEKMSGKDDIWYATNGEIADYVRAFDRLIFSADLSYVENPSAIDVYIDILGKELIVPAGKMIEIK